MSFILSLLLAAGSLPLISGAPLAYSPSRASADAVEVEQATSSHSLNGRSTNLYHAVFGGNGLVSNGWPAMSSWISSFDDMFENNKAIMGSSCSQWGVADTTEAEMATIKSAITNVAGESGVDARFILAIVMQESNGCVRVPTTNYGVVNPGLMQSHNGKGTCNTGSGTAPQNVQSPCPESEIEQMIRDGTMGTADGDGLKQLIEQNGGTSDVTAFYKAARCYNSGSIAANGNLGDGIATHCYASDVANRLLGWSSGTSDCNDNTISSLSGSISSGSSSSGSSGSSSSSTTTSSTKPTAVSTILPQSTTPTSTATSTTTTSSTVHTTSTPVGAVQTPVAQTTPAATTSTTPAPSATASASTLDAPLYPYAISPCQEHYTVVAGDYCQKVEVQFGITAAQLQSWNPGLDESCSNLWKGYRYCVKA